MIESLEGYSRDPGFGQNTVQESGKRLISWQDPGFDFSPGSGTRLNLGMGCGIFFGLNSGNATTQTNVLEAKAAGVSFQTKLQNVLG